MMADDVPRQLPWPVSYEPTAAGYVRRCAARRRTYLDLADCAARMKAMAGDPIIRARGGYEAEIRALQDAAATEWNVLLGAGKAMRARGRA